MSASLAHVGRLEQVAPDLGPGRRRHLLGAHHEHDARGPGGDRLEPLMHGGRAGGAGVLDPARALEAQVRRGLEHQRCGKILAEKPALKCPSTISSTSRGGDPGIGQRLGRHPHDQALDGLTLETPEGGVCPANDASGHGDLLGSSLKVISRTLASTRNARRHGPACRILDVFYHHVRLSRASACLS
jgi:hypothetical protein